MRNSFAGLLLALGLGAGTVFAADAPAAPETPAAATVPAAIEVGDITFTGSFPLAGKTLLLQGAGLRQIVFFKVYGAALYVAKHAASTADVFSADTPRAVRLGLLRNVKGTDFIEALESGLDANLTPEGKSAITNELDQLKDLMRAIGDVKEGDMVDFEYTTENGTTLRLNGKPVGPSIAGKALYDAVLAIWLGDRPIDNRLKEAMMGVR